METESVEVATVLEGIIPVEQEKIHSKMVGAYTRRQQLFVRYFTAILVDLTVLNMFGEHCDAVHIAPFTISFLTAVLLQVLLKTTIRIEHWIGDYFKSKPGALMKVLRILSAWAVLFSSKFAIMEAINFAFGKQVKFHGPGSGIIIFIIVVVVMLLAEGVVVRVYQSLGDSSVKP